MTTVRTSANFNEEKEVIKVPLTYGFDKYRNAFLTVTIPYLVAKISNMWSQPTGPTFWETQWQSIHNIFNGNTFLIIAIGAPILHLIAYWIPASLFTLIDMTDKPKFISRYRIQSDGHTLLSYSTVQKLALVCIGNQIMLGFPFAISAAYYFNWMGWTSSIHLPSYYETVAAMILYTTIFEIVFYYAHRVLHHPFVYKHVHRLHHEFNYPVALVAFYFHPIEVLSTVYLPMLLGPLLYGHHSSLILIWVPLGIIGGIMEHCGYKFPYSSSPQLHTWHHNVPNKIFGMLGVLDWIHGTNTITINKEKKY